MALWVFQILLNVIFVAMAWAALVERRRTRALERRLVALEARLIGDSLPSGPTIQAPIAGSNLSERTNNRPEQSGRSRESLEAYEKAGQMIARGMDPFDVSRKTGLSLAEVQLMGKVSQRSH